MSYSLRNTPKRGGKPVIPCEASPEKKGKPSMEEETPSKGLARAMKELHVDMGNFSPPSVDLSQKRTTRSAGRRGHKLDFDNVDLTPRQMRSAGRQKPAAKTTTAHPKAPSPDAGDLNMDEECECDENVPPAGYVQKRSTSRAARRAANTTGGLAVVSTPRSTRNRSVVRAQLEVEDAMDVDGEEVVARRTRSSSRSRAGLGPVTGMISDESEELLLKKQPVKSLNMKKVELENSKKKPTIPTMRIKKEGAGYRMKNVDSPFRKSPARVVPGASRRAQNVINQLFGESGSSSEDEESSSGVGSEESSEDDMSDGEEDFVKPKRTATKSTPSRARSGSRARVPPLKISLKNLPKSKKKRAPQTLEDLRSCLHTSEVPDKMPCREEEYARIRRFIVDSVSTKGTSQAMYISGVPGTGKTATTQAVVNELSEEYDFTFVYVNAMELIDAKLLFVKVYQEVTGDYKRISAQAARRKLNSMFEMIDRKRPAVVVLVDELDQLCTKRQEIIYDIFNWTVTELARISVIAIANTLDLPERMLSQRITSRLGANRICFQPYEFQQIEQIILTRLEEGKHAISPDAVQFAARKVAAISGDLRKAMDILRRSIEIAVEKGDKKLEMRHVNDANREAAAVPRVSLVTSLPRHAYMLFRAAVSQVQSSGLEEFTFSELYRQYTMLCTQLEGVEPYFEYGVHALMMRMASNRLLIAGPGPNFMTRKVRLGMTTQEAQFAIKQTETAKEEGKIQYTLAG